MWNTRSEPSAAKMALTYLNQPKEWLVLALFPGCSHFQYLITCSKQIQRGKAWEIWGDRG